MNTIRERFALNAAAVLAVLLIALAVAVGAQERRAPVVRTTTRLVQLNVVVVDKKGKPVSGLLQDDFQVLDNGREQKLSHFSVTSTVVPGTKPVASPLVITNRPQKNSEATERTPSITVILVDEFILQNRWASEEAKAPIRSARLAVLKFLATMQPDEQVALYALRQEGVVIIHDLTDDSGALIAAAKTLGTGLNRASIPFGGGQPTDARNMATRNMRAWLESPSRKNTQGQEVERVLVGSAFQAIARHLEGTPGRKNVVWISLTFPSITTGLDPAVMAGERDTILPNAWGPTEPVFANTEGHYEQLRSFARSLSNANVSMYLMDAKGLTTGGGGIIGAGASVRGSNQASQLENTGVAYAPANPDSVSGLFGQRQGMELLASETGGRAFYDTNGLDQHLREVVEEGRVAYLLGYYPGDGNWDGKYHHVEVKLKRPGLTVRCRKGYFAVDEPPTPYQDGVLREAAKSMLEWSGLEVTLNVSSNPLGWFEQDVVVKLDPQEIHFENTDGRWTAQLDVAFVQLGKDGRILKGVKDHLELALYPETYEEASEEGWFYPKTIQVRPEAEKLRVVVRDLATGAVGSVSIPVRHPKGA